MKEKECIKIGKPKEQWIKEFLCKTEPIKENEDFVHANYCTNDNKTKKEIYKGLVDEKYEQIQIIYIYQNLASNINTVLEFKGQLVEENNQIYLLGYFQPHNPNYWKEIIETPGIWFIVPFLLISIILQENFGKELLILVLLSTIGLYFGTKISDKSNIKKMKKWICSI